jgi:hypothetical protein
MTTKYVSIIIRLMMLAAWLPTVAFAGMVAALAPEAAAMGFNVPLVVLVVNFGFSTLAAITTLAIRINAQLMAAPDKPLPHPWVFCIAHIGGSWLAGAFFFIIGQHQQVGLWMGLGIVILASFTGAKALEMAVERYLPTRPVT